jgi:hypothetical protein
MGDDDVSSSAGKTAVPVGLLMWPMLDRSNYSEWAMLMQCNFEAMEVWDVVEQGGKGVKRAHDRLAMSALLRSVPKEMWTTLGAKRTVKEAWDVVKSMRQGADRVKESHAQKLLQEFENIQFKNGELIDEFGCESTRWLRSCVVSVRSWAKHASLRKSSVFSRSSTTKSPCRSRCC